MTCKDCIYEPNCYSRIANGMGDDEIRGGLLTDIDKRCKNFKNKADFVPVVRCKECIYYEPKNSLGTQGICQCGEKETNYGGEFYPLQNDYCSYGERKE